MPSNELAHLFPSATHPALPVATRILSTLRALTAPGKGNDLRPEERPALVGIAALLACERIQSHDLAPTAVQRAMSVSPARFKSAMATSRSLLASNDAPSPSRRSAPSTPSAQRVSTMPAPTPPSIKFDPHSPFTTPRKKFRAASTKDLTGLLTPHKHSPAASSPLRTATTPSGKKRALGDDEDATPTKRTRTSATRDEVREEMEEAGDPQTPSRRASSRAAAKAKQSERDGMAAFLALRPGGAADIVDKEAQARAEANKAPEPQAQLATVDLQAEIDAVMGRRNKRRMRERRDWTFREEVWAPKREEMVRILAAARAEMEKEGEGEGTEGEGDGGEGKSPANSKGKEGDFGAQVVGVLLAAYA